MSAIKLSTPSSGSISLTPADTASNLTITVPANAGTMITTGSTFAGTGPAFRAFQSGGQSFSSGTDTKMVLNSEVFDTAGVFNNTGSTVGGNPSYSFMPNVAGYYQINGRVGLASFSYDWGFCSIWKNNSLIARGSASNTTSFSGSVVSDIVYLNGTTDYVSFYMIVNTGSPETENAGGAQFMTYFSGALVRAA